MHGGAPQAQGAARRAGRGAGWGEHAGRKGGAQVFEREAGTADDDEVARIEQRFRLTPFCKVEKGIGANQEVEACGTGKTPAISADEVNGIKSAAAGEVRTRLGEGGDEAGTAGARERDHGAAMRVGTERRAALVRGGAGDDEMDGVETKAHTRGTSGGEMARVNRVKRAAEERERAKAKGWKGEHVVQFSGPPE